jgi:hypothetical protein
MKVEIIQVSEAHFRSRWSWWSQWIDVALFDYECRPWLIQMRVSRTNAKSFKSIPVTGRFYRQTTCAQVGDLTQMKRSA